MGIAYGTRFCHVVSHVSMFKKFLGNPASILRDEIFWVEEDLSYEEVNV